MFNMNFKRVFAETTMGDYARSIKAAPREVIFNGNLIFSTIVYSMAAFSNCWDQGASSTMPVLPGFQRHFGLSEEVNADEISDFISLVYLGMAAGAALSFFINDRIGRLWSFRLYTVIWVVGQFINAFTPTVAGLNASRIVGGLGIGALSAIGTMAIVEIALQRYVVCLPPVCFAPCIFMAFCVLASFYACESPRWLFLVGRREEAVDVLSKLRGLPVSHSRMQAEILEIEESIRKEREGFGSTDRSSNMLSILKETFTIPSNLRRVQQSLVSYALAQLSGANMITSYFVPILNLLGTSGGAAHSLFLSGMYGFSKLCFVTIASFFFIDALGRRKSLFVGTSIQMLTDIYIGVYLRYSQAGGTSDAASRAALAFIFLHAFGYAVGLYILPYVFGSELWPNRIRSFGSAMSQCWHWLFCYAMNAALPSLLSSTNNWGAFIFFAAWCFVSLVYVFLMVPEVAGLALEQIDEVFKGPWFNAYKQSRRLTTIPGVDSQDVEDISPGEVRSKVKTKEG
ncbi:hypothetical protein NM208_g3941 [Fusarium decemcellulare]|uniref:Uncharacterized protein n=1 Tax=Fusarium decemcellulare TaxID=57161 RepID=A0ACC1SMI3_9HYPO|nr:hypothetical protein NM208_g3941 [Fusarium decemcellulare]